jgi:hypothetical protein
VFGRDVANGAHLKGTIVLALTANPHDALRGVWPGVTLRARAVGIAAGKR